jgi:hypothetical protein
MTTLDDFPSKRAPIPQCNVHGCDGKLKVNYGGPRETWRVYCPDCGKVY